MRKHDSIFESDPDSEIDGLKALVKLYKRVFWVIVAVAVVAIVATIIIIL